VAAAPAPTPPAARTSDAKPPGSAAVTEPKPPEAKPAEPKPTEPMPAEPKPAQPKPAPAQAGDDKVSVSGVVKFKGPPPKRGVIQAVMQNAECGKLHKQPMPDDSLVVGDDGAIENVIVHVSAGLPTGKQWPVPGEPVKFDQQGCRYTPHVVSMMVGQKLNAANSDPFLHNVHPLPNLNPQSNNAQPGKTPEAGQTIMVPKAAEFFKVKCDVHPWMAAYVGVFDHPFHSVTGEDGFFSLRSLPPGKYTLTAWHETLGQQTKQVTVKDGEPAEVEFAFEKK
jgi:hypothetical protein